MKKWFLGLLAITLTGALSVSTYAAYNHHRGPDRHDNNWNNHDQHPYYRNNSQYYNQDQVQARTIIHRTALVLSDAQRYASHGHFRHGLAQAFAHQRKAQDLYWQGSYQDAIFHSLRARRLAIQVIEGNGQGLRHEYNWDNVENDYRHRAPRDKDLDIRLDWRNIGSDDEVLHLNLNFDIDL